LVSRASFDTTADLDNDLIAGFVAHGFVKYLEAVQI